MTDAENIVALVMKMMMIISKDGTIQTLHQVQAVNITKHIHYAKYRQ